MEIAFGIENNLDSPFKYQLGGALPSVPSMPTFTWGNGSTTTNNPDGSQNVTINGGATTNETISVAFEAFADYQASPVAGGGTRLQIVRGDGYTVGITARYNDSIGGIIINDLGGVFGPRWQRADWWNGTPVLDNVPTGVQTWGIRVLSDGTIQVLFPNTTTWLEISLFIFDEKFGTPAQNSPSTYTKIPPDQTTFAFNVRHGDNFSYTYQNIRIVSQEMTEPVKIYNETAIHRLTEALDVPINGFRVLADSWLDIIETFVLVEHFFLGKFVKSYRYKFEINPKQKQVCSDLFFENLRHNPHTKISLIVPKNSSIQVLMF